MMIAPWTINHFVRMESVQVLKIIGPEKNILNIIFLPSATLVKFLYYKLFISLQNAILKKREG